MNTTPGTANHDVRLEVRVLGEAAGSTLADDVRRGLMRRPKSLPPKYFYDDRGSKLFDRICDTEEYYQTRTELALLESISSDLIGSFEPTDIVELGSGAARKTRALLDAAERSKVRCRYVPFDVSESMLRSSAAGLIERYPWLEVCGVVGDFERHLDRIPSGARRLFVFLGGTIGNFDDEQVQVFLEAVSRTMTSRDRFLLGTDLVKDPSVLNSAYNDAAGVTAAFNKNVLAVINRELGARFELDQFRHVAFFNENRSQIEMHLESKQHQSVPVPALGNEVILERGERILTEISRKFTRESVRELLATAGLTLETWHEPENRYFGLSVSRKGGGCQVTAA